MRAAMNALGCHEFRSVLVAIIQAASWLFAISAHADQIMLRGRVVDTQQYSLAGIRIAAEFGSKRIVLVDATPIDGSFSAALSAVVPVQELQVGVNVTFEGTGYVRQVRLVKPDVGNRTVEIRLDAAGTSADKKDVSGRTLYLLPYQVSGAGGEFGKWLVPQIRRSINTHLQRLGMADVEVLLVPAPADTATQAVREWGIKLNALAIIDGQMDTSQGQGGQETVSISSRFTIMPTLPGFDPSENYVDDAISIGELTSTQLFKKLDIRWARNTTLAVGVLEAKRALGVGDQQGLVRVHTYLVAEKADAGPGDEPALQQIDRLRALIENRMARRNEPGQ